MNENVEEVFMNIHVINIEVISEIQKEIVPYDNISLVFLLYNNPNTALERLIVYQRIAEDEEAMNMNLLCDWAQHAQMRHTWRYEFLEALAVCQLYGIIRKLGFNVKSVKEHFKPDEIYISTYLHPMKKALYKLCENITSKNLIKLQRTLETYNIGIRKYETFELSLLELMCQKFISVNLSSSGNYPENEYNIENLTNIIRNIPGLKHFSVSLLELQNRLNGKSILNQHDIERTTTEQAIAMDKEKNNNYDKMFLHDLQDAMNLLDEMDIRDIENIKSDKNIFNKNDIFEIKNPKRIGVCYVINMENFYLSKDNIDSDVTLLEDRVGSTRDKKFLEQTMKDLNFEVICHDNLDHKQMLQYLSDIIKYRVQYDDSIFMLCILSHGVKDHVFAADCIKINVYDNIQKLLDSDEMPKHFHEMPKIFIIQACQVVDDPQHRLVADAPTFNNSHLKKSEFLIYWATAPELEAFRDEKKGSIFIQFLCCIIRKYGKHEHINDIFTRVNACVKRISQKLKCNQVATFNNTLTKNLYLHIPNGKV